MEETIGKALRDARLKKGLTPDDVAKATKIRVDWIIDLENEDYHRFPSLGYARNFQILYAKFLDVEVKSHAALDPGKRVLTTSFDHIYEGVTPVGYRGMARRKPIRRSRWLLVIIVFTTACIAGTITALSILDILRLPSWEEMTGEAQEDEELVAPPAPLPEPSATPTPEPSPTPEQLSMPEPLTAPLRATELFPFSAGLRELIEQAEAFRTRPTSEVDFSEEAESFETDADALATPFPPEVPTESLSESFDEAPALEDAPSVSAGREPTEAPAAIRRPHRLTQ